MPSTRVNGGINRGELLKLTGVERPPQGRNYGRISNYNSNGNTLVNYLNHKTIREDQSKIKITGVGNHPTREKHMERTDKRKDIIILILIGIIIGIGIATWIRERQLDNMEWYENRIQCLEEAPRYHNAWCDDNNNLIK